MDISAIGVKLTSLWKDILSVPPPSNATELWKEHIFIRNELASVSAIQKAWKRPDRSDFVTPFVKWSDEAGVRHEGVQIKQTATGLSLTLSKSFTKETLIVDVPRKIVLSLDYVQQCPTLSAIFENDEMLKAMDNVALVMVVAHEVLKDESSQWAPYLSILPNNFTTPIFYSLEQLQALKPSPIFEEALHMHRSVARQFVYFYLRILGDSKHTSKTKKKNGAKKTAPFAQSPFTTLNFTFDFYRWCVSVVSTRINMVPSISRSKNGEAILVPALIPFIDLANHDHSANESGSIYYDTVTDAIHLQIHQDLEPNAEVLIYYGVRTNIKFLLHNGFVPPLPNPDDAYDIKLGLPRSPDSNFKIHHLKKFGIHPVSPINNIYSFALNTRITTENLHDSVLWQFARVFIAKSEEDIGDPSLDGRAKRFLADRFRILLAGYSRLAEKEDDISEDNEQSVMQLSAYDTVMHYFILFNKERKVRLQRWFEHPASDEDKKSLMDRLMDEILSRNSGSCNFLEIDGLTVAYRRYATLYFCCGFDESDNELMHLDIIHKFVEILDNYFSGVCELDVVFNCEKAYFLLDEYLLAGEVQESSVSEVIKAVRAQDKKQEVLMFC
ncbi:clathrin adaptor complex small chain domain-containing protein [Ditylenchus destructor]|nr:clathrin adaptor complex small chain domain-containing protein [Ditylenchus destructor]